MGRRLPPRVILGTAHDSNLGWSLADVEAAEAAERAEAARSGTGGLNFR